MIFKPRTYRIGYGKNIHSLTSGGEITLFYKARDGKVKSKIITRKGGGVELKKGNLEFVAREVVPLLGGLYLSRGEKQIKVIKSEE